MASEKLYLIGEKDGKLLTATESEIINNALEQEKAESIHTLHFMTIRINVLLLIRVGVYGQVSIMVVAWFIAVMMEKWLL